MYTNNISINYMLGLAENDPNRFLLEVFKGAVAPYEYLREHLLKGADFVRSLLVINPSSQGYKKPSRTKVGNIFNSIHKEESE